MYPDNTRWKLSKCDAALIKELSAGTGLRPTAARVLANRGIDTIESARLFLEKSLDSLPDPFLLPDAMAACLRIKKAVDEREKILVYGDYDGDGVTSAALLKKLLTVLKADVDVFVPHRNRDGYDLQHAGVEKAHEIGAKLIVTCDCGITRVDEVEIARSYGIDVVITDHHTPGDVLPAATAVVNPHRKDSIYPFRFLAGVGVAFRLGEALARLFDMNVNQYRNAYLDLAAIGTVTDVMQMRGDNRILVEHGLDRLSSTKKPGLQQILKVIKKGDVRQLDTHDIGYYIGPLLNAASRMGETRMALDLLLTKDEDAAEHLAEKLNSMNCERKKIQQDALIEAYRLVEADPASKCAVLYLPGCPNGVIGLVAGRVKDRYYKPCVVMSDDKDGMLRGSARSIQGFSIYDALKSCAVLFESFGGHELAAGFSIHSDRREELVEKLKDFACAQLSDDDLIPVLQVDVEVEISDVDRELFDELQRLAPFGAGNAVPVLISRNVRLLERRIFGADRTHLKLVFEAGSGRNIETFPLWGEAENIDDWTVGMKYDLCYELCLNKWNNRETIQLAMLSMRETAIR